jgi:hypothetical protein
MKGLFGNVVYEKLYHVGVCVECGEKHRGKKIGSVFYCFRCLGKVRKLKRELKKFVRNDRQLMFHFMYC